jgi:pyruvate dehydrogenase E2 component (dihydrolipoamide acetyltransferase)
MATEVKLPRLGQGMESGTIVKWLKAEGDRVEKGEPLYELDTDKATQEVEAEASGVLLKIAVASGEVEVGRTVATIGEEGEAVASSDDTPPEPAQEAPAPEAAEKSADKNDKPEAAEKSEDENGKDDSRREAAPAGKVKREEQSDFRTAINGARGKGAGRLKASPLARRIARERGIELRDVTGTGPDGRIVAEDVEQAEVAPAEVAPAVAPAATGAPALPPPVVTGELESIPLTKIRKTIARRLTAAWQVPVFQLTVSIDMTNANALVERSRELNPEIRVTVTDLLAKVCAQGLMRHHEVNAQYTEEALLLFPSANIGIAVAAPQGLVVPVIRSVERLALHEVAHTRADLVERARSGKLQTADLEDGTFTISNLGMFGVEQFIAVLNPPQAAILAVGATVDQPVVRAGAIVARPIMTVTLTVDHRAVDGGPAADFLRTIKLFLEDPALAL